MEKLVAGFAVLGALLVANVSVSEAQTVEKYFRVGGDLQLSPVPVSQQIYSIVWKYDKNLLAEWVKDAINLTYYSKFKVRSELNTDTGVLVIHSMTANDTGVYSVEINNKVQSQVYQTVEIQEVGQPTVERQPLTCARPQRCSLKCHGDITKAGPVSYFWKKDDGGWEPSGDKKDLSDEEMDSVKTFYCRMENPVSKKYSEAFQNPFYREKTPTESSSAGPIVGIVIGVLLLVSVILIGLGIWKRDQVRQKLPCLGSNANLESVPKNKVEDEGLLNNTGKSPSPTSADKADDNELTAVIPSNPTDIPVTNDDKGEGDVVPKS